MLSRRQRILWPLGAGVVGSLGLTLVYLGIVALAESPKHAVEQFWQDRWIVIPIIIGFGIQAGLYVILKKRLFIPVVETGSSGKLMGAGGATSTVAMVACCAHHVTDALPFLGLAAASTFLAQYRTVFMIAGLGINLLGIAVMTYLLLQERRKALELILAPVEAV